MKTFHTQGTCSRAINYEVADGIVTACEFKGPAVMNDLRERLAAKKGKGR